MSPRVPRAGGGRLRRTWPQRLLISVNIVCIIGALVGAGHGGLRQATVAQIPRISLDIGRACITPADDLPPGEPQNFLIVGVDSDENLAPDDPVRDGRDSATEGTLRSDTIMIVRVDPGTSTCRCCRSRGTCW
jgi:anionic cell wall polymer biosynthesis LytR-Cps2A-Psr (LCP) family protein